MTDGSSNARLTLAVDVLGIAAFVLIGMRSHSDAAAVSIFLRNFVPFTGSWVVVAWLVGTYRPPTRIGLIATLLIAIPIGVLLRALWVRSWSAGEVLTFALVALVFATMLIGLGRAISAVLGAKLFDRSGGKVALTAAGKVFLRYAEETLEARRVVMTTVQEMERVPRGEIVVAANEGTCLHILPEVFAEFKNLYPNVGVQIIRLEPRSWCPSTTMRWTLAWYPFLWMISALQS